MGLNQILCPYDPVSIAQGLKLAVKKSIVLSTYRYLLPDLSKADV